MSTDQKGILLIILGMMLFGVHDLTIKSMVNTGSLLQIITLRGLIGSVILAVFLKSTGRSFSIRSHYPLLAITRGILFPVGFLCFYLALAKMPIAEASALFFVSPIFMTILSRIILKNKIGIYRISAIIFGFIGVLLIIKPQFENFDLVMLLPLLCAFTYSVSMIITKVTKDKDTTFQQTTHVYLGSIILGILIYTIFGDYYDNIEGSPSLSYLLRPWIFIEFNIFYKLIIISVFGTSGILCLIQAYRIGLPSVISPFEYTLLINSVAIGYFIFNETPDFYSMLGIALIIASGIFIFIREKGNKNQIVTETSLRT
jgi:drug/metabolite transporter (DMT)-like permease